MKNKFLNLNRNAMIYLVVIGIAFAFNACKPKTGGKTDGSFVSSDAAQAVYVAPGSYDEFYSFMSGGFSGQLTIYGLPSGRLFREIPVFSQHPESGYGYSEESKPMPMTTNGFIPWDDSHHPVLSQTGGVADGKWLFINGNNTPRIARIDLTTMRTVEIIEIPNSSGNHSSPYTTENSEYVVAGTRFSVPIGGNLDVPINTYKENFKGTISYVKVDPIHGDMSLAFQIMTPPFNWDLSRSGKGPSADWTFFTCYNSERANTLLEANASQNDKDFILAINWKLAEKYVAEGKAREVSTEYYRNYMDEKKHLAVSEVNNMVKY